MSPPKGVPRPLPVLRKPRKNAKAKRASAETIALGQRLAKYRIERGLTQTTLAERINWLPSQVARLECAHHEFSVQTLRTYLKALDMTIEISAQNGPIR